MLCWQFEKADKTQMKAFNNITSLLKQHICTISTSKMFVLMSSILKTNNRLTSVPTINIANFLHQWKINAWKTLSHRLIQIRQIAALLHKIQHFEILSWQDVSGIKPLSYLSKYVAWSYCIGIIFYLCHLNNCAPSKCACNYFFFFYLLIS